MWFFCQAEDGIRDLVRSRGLGDVYKRQEQQGEEDPPADDLPWADRHEHQEVERQEAPQQIGCLLYTSDAADERSSVDLGGRRIIKKKNKTETRACCSRETNTEREEHEVKSTLTKSDKESKS